MTDFVWTADEALAAFQRMVRKQDYWRGYIGGDGGDPSDDEVVQWLQDARDALKRSPLCDALANAARAYLDAPTPWYTGEPGDEHDVTENALYAALDALEEAQPASGS